MRRIPRIEQIAQDLIIQPARHAAYVPSRIDVATAPAAERSQANEHDRACVVRAVVLERDAAGRSATHCPHGLEGKRHFRRDAGAALVAFSRAGLHAFRRRSAPARRLTSDARSLRFGLGRACGRSGDEDDAEGREHAQRHHGFDPSCKHRAHECSCSAHALHRSEYA